MLECLIDSEFGQCYGRVGIPLCSATRWNIHHSDDADYKTDLIQKVEDRLSRIFDVSFRFIDDLSS